MMKISIIRSAAGRTALCSLLGAAAGAASLFLTRSRRRRLCRSAKRTLRQLHGLLDTAQRMLRAL
ncbi:MAG: hypothetical protein IKV55_04930 [Oscillospiraceae bacterium]|nr:hypothetical protein [Oscillospiraceae bacterium]